MCRCRCYVGLLLTISIVSCRKNERSADTGRIGQPVVDESYRISQPDVTHHEATYNIFFQQYDMINVRAGGCVTIYSDPFNQGYNSFWRYNYLNSHMGAVNLADAGGTGHGLIWIPGATAGLEPIASVIARGPVFIRAVPPGAGVNPQLIQLVLGYDQFHSTNNYDPYSNFDCPPPYEPAWVELDVTHNNQPPVIPCPFPAQPSSFVDMYWTTVDSNMLPLNPMWGKQCGDLPSPITPVYPDAQCNYWQSDTPPCTTHVLSVNALPHQLFGICGPVYNPDIDAHGHLNWGWATFTNGTIYYNNYSGSDHDINAIYFSDNRSVFANNPHYLGDIRGLDLEFDARETLDQMLNGWWNFFRQSDDGLRHFAMDGKPAQIVGLLTVDLVERDQAELHPIIGLAIKYRSSPYDSWAVFARPWGDEGYCGPSIVDSGINNFPPGDMRFMLPHGFSTPHVRTRYFSQANVDTSFPGQALLTLRFPGPLNYGEIDISPPCNPDTCHTGCCLNDGFCFDCSDDSTACGTGGQTCFTCPAGSSCICGTCTPCPFCGMRCCPPDICLDQYTCSNR